MNKINTLSQNEKKIVYYGILIIACICIFFVSIVSYGGWITNEEYQALEQEVLQIKNELENKKEDLKFINGDYFEISGEKQFKGVRIMVSMNKNGEIECEINDFFKAPVIQIVAAFGTTSIALMFLKTFLDSLDVLNFRD